MTVHHMNDPQPGDETMYVFDIETLNVIEVNVIGRKGTYVLCHDVDMARDHAYHTYAESLGKDAHEAIAIRGGELRNKLFDLKNEKIELERQIDRLSELMTNHHIPERQS